MCACQRVGGDGINVALSECAAHILRWRATISPSGPNAKHVL